MSSPLPAPKVWPVADSAWQIRLPLPWALKSVNVFLFRAANGFLLLDTGIRSEACLQALEASLATLGIPWSSITEILVSHLHPDHIGAAAEIRRRSGAPVRMPALEAELVKPLGPDRKFFAEAAPFLLSNGIPRDDVEAMRQSAARGTQAYERLVVDGTIAEGELIRFQGGTLEAVPAPGHSPAQLCFYCREQRVLFSTDAILPRVTPNVGVDWYYRGNPLGEYLDTLATLERLEVDLVVPSHGKPFHGHREWIDSTRRHHERRCDAVLEALRAGPADAYAIAATLWGGDMGLSDRRFGMSEALSHLHYMALDKRVEKVPVNGVALWRRT